MSTQLQSVKDLFVHLISDVPPEQWEQALLRLCPNDAALSEQIRDLLTAHQEQDSLLDRPDPEATSPTATSPDHDPDHDEVQIRQRIGPYKLLQKIGEGGMGMVYMAEQTEPVRRKVALKIIKPGMDTKEVIARFEAERQALALMDHPNIARVLGGGVTETGRPYFVMDLVHGTQLNKFCDQTRMTTQQRLELFLDVCRAVQHAHQKGIIHRDLKPTNVLVSMDDVRPVPKVIDFGVAKALSQQLTEKTLFTAYGQMIGTPLYMSPEQTQYSTQDIDTRSDIYSLGVLLYELMTGSTPFDRETLKKSGYEAMRKMICEVDPPRPSHRLATLNQAARTTVADQRNVDPRKLQDSLKGELDWIVMKALEKDRNRRYETVNSLAADIQRYLNNEPVLACPPSTVYRARKFISRNKGLIVTGSLTLLALIVGLGIALWQAVRASQAEILAVSERDRALASERENLSLLYVADIQRAEEAWYDRDAFQMRRILEAQIPGPRQDDYRGIEWHYLMKQQSQLRQELLPRGSPVYDLLRLPDQKLAAAGADGLIRLFDTVSGKVVRTLNSEQGEINGLALSPSGNLFASAGDDGTIVVREFPSMALKWQVKGHEKQAFQVAFTPDSRAIISAGNEPDARVWDAQTGVQLKRLSTDGFDLESVSVSADSQVALGTFSGGVWLFDQDFQRSGVPLPKESRSIAKFCHSGDVVAEGYQDGEMIIRSMAHPAQVLARWQLPDSVKSIVFSPDDRWLAAGDSTGAVHLLPLSTAEAGAGEASDKTSQRVHTESATWHAHEGKIYALEFDEEGRSLFITGGDGSIVSWRLAESQTSFTDFENTNDAHFLGSERILWATTSALRLTSRDLDTIATVPSSAEWHWLASARECDRICATQRNESQIVEIDPETLVSKDVWTVAENARYQALALSPDGQTLVVSTTLPGSDEEKPAQFLEIVDLGSHSRLIRIPALAVFDIKFAPDGSCFAFAESNEIHLVETRNWQVLRSFIGHATTVNRMSWFATGSILASVSSDRTLRLWEPDSGKELWSTVVHRSRARDVAFTPDGKTLVTVGEDGYVRFWHWPSKRLALRVPVETQSVKHVRISPDGKQLIVIYFSGKSELIDARIPSHPKLRASSAAQTTPAHPTESRTVPQSPPGITGPFEAKSNHPPPPDVPE